MLVYKTIYRVDFPISYALLDNMGKFAHFIHTETASEPYLERATNLDVVTHTLSSRGKLHNATYTLNATLQTIDGDIEFTEGIETRRLSDLPILHLADRLLKEYSEAGLAEYKRVGFRTWILFETNEIHYETLLNYFLRENRNYLSAINEKFALPTDIGIVVESKNTEDRFIRIWLGPYRNAERQKYFNRTTPELESGIIMDIDMWEISLQVPGLKLSNKVRTYQRHIFEIGSTLFSNISKNINGEQQ